MQAPVALDRLLGLVLALDEDKPVSAPELAQRLGVSLRTVYRDVKRLQDAGVPVVSEPGRGGGLCLMPGFRMAPLALTRSETLALTLAIEQLRTLPTQPFAAALDTAARKIANAARVARPELLQQPQRWLRVEPLAQDCFHPERPSPAPAGQVGAVVQTFVEALLEGRRLRIDYHSPYRDGAETRDYDPAGLLLDRGLWYLVAYPSGQLERPRHLRADRVRHCQPGERLALDRLPPWRPAQQRPWLREAMQRWIETSPVRLLISAAQAERLGRDWFFGSAELRPLPDGQFEFCWGENEFERVRELLAWLGAPARLLAPAEWIEPMRQALIAHAQSQQSG
ncbi:helix-turn-helix transcriptional regulator [Inhella proteolytica]|uniref:YafY family transcriptional regulator n=1 Tax=Inhella proteolytica TaxID=2795029 RepID=A0A931J5K3_9BURK|nr:YafY family protein [Inhella proteolytica]MBH9577272.1 YafY family transcriptional regulator [Inhella proteolytica]